MSDKLIAQLTNTQPPVFSGLDLLVKAPLVSGSDQTTPSNNVYGDAQGIFAKDFLAGAFGTAAGQIAQGGVITAGGPVGSATVAPIVTFNAAGQLTAVSSATITPAVGSITGLGTGVSTALAATAGAAGGFATYSSLGTAAFTASGAYDAAGAAAAAVVGMVKVLGQSGIPFVVAGSGSMGNNGALTLTTALPATYASGYVLLPAGAIATGVPAAATWYYFTASSGTALTVFNNTYTSGTPAIPGSPTAFVTTGPGAYTGVSGAVTAYQLSISGNTIGINGGLRIETSWGGTNAAGNKTLSITFGGTSLTGNIAATTSAVAVTTLSGFKNRGVANKQIPLGLPGNAAGLGNTATAFTYGSVDTTSAQTLAVTMNNTTPATNNAIIEAVTVELLPSVT